MKNLLLLFFCLLFTGWLSAQSKTIQELKEKEVIRTGYYLYPSTIRMLNFGDDPELNRLVKDVRKLSLLNLRSNKFDQARMTATIERLQESEQMETYLEVNDDSLYLIILGNQKDEELVTIARNKEDFYIAELEGTMNLGVLPKLIESFNNRDTTESTGLSMIYGAISEDINQQKYWEKRREEWRKEREKEKEENKKTENTPADSTVVEDTLKTEKIKGPDNN